MFGKTIDKSIAENPAKNPIDSILSNPLLKTTLKSYRKEIFAAMQSGEKDLIKLIENIELLPGEKQAAPVLDIDFNSSGEKEIRLLIVAFDDKMTITRMISDTPLREFLTNWLNSKLK